ncbi:SIS domain-containing protein [Conexibacter woesei]|uniref:SIS domain-containing protein n=1 Tax=Conexibacter woesei TaxID=191495 RepID=UPI0004150B98|nr:SIS domain-containing protein [Conexibacter woesei]
MSAAAAVLREEIGGQPAVWRALVARGAQVAEVAAALDALDPPLVRIAAHGTSDHAGIYATYLLRALRGWTVVRDSMSMPLYYGSPAARPGELAVGISQSGETPDVVAWLERAGREGATTLAITNGEGSSLARIADHVLAIGAGAERSIAATKTYTGTLAAIALLAGQLAGRGPQLADALVATADAADALLDGLDAAVAPVAAALARIDRMYLVARGIELATANEVALKLTEVCYLGAKAMSATAMAHGPVAALDADVPLWAIAAPDATLPAVAEAVRRARAAGAPVIASGPAAAALDGAAFALPVPVVPAEPLLSPLLSVLPGQAFAWALAGAKGIDAGAPRHLRKVTSAA